MKLMLWKAGTVIEEESFMEDSWDYDAALRGIAYARVLKRRNAGENIPDGPLFDAALEDEVRKIASRQAPWETT